VFLNSNFNFLLSNSIEMEIKDIKIFVIVIVSFLVGALIFQFIFSKFIYKHGELEQCKTFLTSNSIVQDYFGSVKSVKPKLSGGSRQVSSTGEISGSFVCKIKGTKRKGVVRVDWQKKNDKLDVIQISTRQGLAGTRVLWPDAKATSVDYILPSNIWDGIILLAGLPLLLALYINTKREGIFIKFIFPLITWRERGRRVMELLFLFGVFVNILWSILCFFNIATLF
jgi:hypothetical protein